MNPPELRPLLVHYHIFKNAGSSFAFALRSAFAQRFREYDSAFPRGRLSPAELADFVAEHPEVDAISSHQAILPPPEIPGRRTLGSILIRQPLARIRSMYEFEQRQEADTPGADKAKETNLKGYVEWRLATYPVAICNFQVHFCSRGKLPSPADEPGQSQLATAIANLEQLDVVGTVERYEEWLALAQHTLVSLFPGISLVSARVNASGGTGLADKSALLEALAEELGEELLDYLIEANQLDLRLHEAADAILTRNGGEH